MSLDSAGSRLRRALEVEKPLQIAGTINAYSALLAERAGFRAIYLSGAGVANASFGLPDLGMTGLADVAEDCRRITERCSLPLLVDADTGWGGKLNVARTVKVLEKSGAAGIHLEDQVLAKRCGHRPGKSLISESAMVEKIRAAVEGRNNPDFVIMARTDAAGVTGLADAVHRAQSYVAAGADFIFAEALTSLEEFRAFTSGISVPVLANMTEFGKTPQFSLEDFRAAGVAMVLYPLSAFRAMAQAAEMAYEAIRKEGSQSSVVGRMQTRTRLYDVLNYEYFENRIDESTEG